MILEINDTFFPSYLCEQYTFEYTFLLFERKKKEKEKENEKERKIKSKYTIYNNFNIHS